MDSSLVCDGLTGTVPVLAPWILPENALHALVGLIPSLSCHYKYKHCRCERVPLLWPLLLMHYSMRHTKGPNQDHCKKKYGANGTQIMMYCNLWALLFTVTGVLHTDGMGGVEFFMREPELAEKASDCGLLTSAVFSLFELPSTRTKQWSSRVALTLNPVTLANIGADFLRHECTWTKFHLLHTPPLRIVGSCTELCSLVVDSVRGVLFRCTLED
jgi:hypothetical protein